MKILAFAPHAAIWVHAFPEALVLESLKQNGHEIVYVSCGRQFDEYCIPMDSFGLERNSSREDKDEICEKCVRSKDFIRKRFSFGGNDVTDLLSPSDVTIISKTYESATPQNFQDIILDEIPIGRYALYEFLLKTKKNSICFNENEWDLFGPYLKNSITSYFSSKNAIEREKPDVVVTYNAFYSVNHVFCDVAEKSGIPHYFLHAGGNLSTWLKTITVTKGYTNLYLKDNPNWEYYKNSPCNRQQLSNVTDHILTLLEGKNVFVYSSPKSKDRSDLRTMFGVRPDQKVLLATMSSRDERFAAETIGVMDAVFPGAFKDQSDWIRSVIDFMKQRSDLFLIIRPHPRDFPNKREKQKSSQARSFDSLFENLPDNVRVNWPSDNISLYDWTSSIDVCLNAWSSAGKEMGYFGVPVVLYSSELVLSYPADINLVGDSKTSFFAKIDDALQMGRSIEFVRKAYRWAVFEYSHFAMDISESFDPNRRKSMGKLNRRLRKLATKFYPDLEWETDFRHRSSQLKSASAINELISENLDTVLDIWDKPERFDVSVDEETQSLMDELDRLSMAMHGAPSMILPSVR